MTHRVWSFYIWSKIPFWLINPIFFFQYHKWVFLFPFSLCATSIFYSTARGSDQPAVSQLNSLKKKGNDFLQKLLMNFRLFYSSFNERTCPRWRFEHVILRNVPHHFASRFIHQRENIKEKNECLNQLRHGARLNRTRISNKKFARNNHCVGIYKKTDAEWGSVFSLRGNEEKLGY